MFASMSGPTVLELKSVERQLGDRIVLRDIDCSLAAGHTLTVFGANGAGKTTLLRMIATLLAPSGGSVTLFELPLPDAAYEVRARIGLVAHDSLLYRQLSGRENLRFYARLYGVEESEARIAELLAQVKLSARADEPVRTLSRGMVQRLAVCRAVLHHPELLLLDEPYSHLDPNATELIEPLIGRTAGLSRVLVTHDLEAGLDEADSIVGLADGRLTVSCNAKETDPTALRAALYGATT